ncbi:MAG: hypothetical protein AB1Z19_05095 [Eubacteriales bacterium]
MKYLKQKMIVLACALSILCLFGCADGADSENIPTDSVAPQAEKAVQSPVLPAVFFISDISADAYTGKVMIGVTSIGGQKTAIAVNLNGEAVGPQSYDMQTWFFSLPIVPGTVNDVTVKAIGVDGTATEQALSLLLVNEQGAADMAKEDAKEVTFLIVKGGMDDFSVLERFSNLSALCLVDSDAVAVPDDLNMQDLQYLYIDGYSGTFTTGQALGHIRTLVIKTEAGTIAGDFSALPELEHVVLQGVVETQALSSLGYCKRLRSFEIHDENASIPQEAFSHWRALVRLAIDGANTGVSLYDLRQMPELSYLSLNHTDVTGDIEDLLLLEKLETLVLERVSVRGDIDTLCGLPALSEAVLENCDGLEGDGAKLADQLDGNFGYQAGAESVTAESVIGRYSGNYKNNSGMMNLVIEIVAIDANNRVIANFEFEPIAGNNQGKSGKYRLTGSFDPEFGEIVLSPDRWLSAQPAGYEMLAIEGTVDGNQFKGKLDREYLPYFTAEKQ